MARGDSHLRSQPLPLLVVEEAMDVVHCLDVSTGETPMVRVHTTDIQLFDENEYWTFGEGACLPSVRICIEECMHEKPNSCKKQLYVIMSNSGGYGSYFFVYSHNNMQDLRFLAKILVGPESWFQQNWPYLLQESNFHQNSGIGICNLEWLIDLNDIKYSQNPVLPLSFFGTHQFHIQHLKY